LDRGLPYEATTAATESARVFVWVVKEVIYERIVSCLTASEEGVASTSTRKAEIGASIGVEMMSIESRTYCTTSSRVMASTTHVNNSWAAILNYSRRPRIKLRSNHPG
jgi:hypothetical protein